ncbi:MAG: hypothetical protein A2096_02985 [Spirochaetes bacterium GWF1_41_5]|nr:MAG: hypothetical protein A2096_02985 [Spirochaetes bacterium GWF1_41_5]
MKDPKYKEDMGSSALPEMTSLYEFKYENDLTRMINNVHYHEYFFHWIETAWAVMLMKKQLIPEKYYSKIISCIYEYVDLCNETYNGFGGLQKYVIKKFGIRVGGSLTLARTIPPGRQIIPVRKETLKVICVLHDFLESLLAFAEKNLDAIMPGYTHIRHAQPTTLGHYLLSVYDPMVRAVKNIEVGYQNINANEFGCAALAGTSWNIDRDLITKYLGFDWLIENTNDAVSFSDGYISLISALANFMIILSQLCLELNFWSGLEYDFLYVPFLTSEQTFQKEGGKGKSHSHLMPNKTCNPPCLERARVGAAQLVGCLTEAVAMTMRAPHGDGHEFLHVKDPVMAALRATYLYSHPFIHTFPRIISKRDNMLKTARRGYSCAVELANELVRRFGLDYRTAHEIVNEFIIVSEKKTIPSELADINIFTSACERVINKKLAITEEELRKCLDPVEFINKTRSKGSVNPDECRRMIKERKKDICQMKNNQKMRIKKLLNAKTIMLNDLKLLKKKYL